MKKAGSHGDHRGDFLACQDEERASTLVNLANKQHW